MSIDASDLDVVELTNTNDHGLEVMLHLGGSSRRVSTLAPGQSILLVAPRGATWSFGPVAAPATGSGNTNPLDPPFDDDDDPAPDGGARGTRQAN